MDIEEFCKSVLFGSQLSDKLVEGDPRVIKHQALGEVPACPGRPKSLSFARPGKKVAFPDSDKMFLAETRGLVLHFFANHELLALELMALALLKFPESDYSFKTGILRTMQEEQHHLKLYIRRMRELGVEFGDFPVNNFFWKHISRMKSPLDYTVLMSMTFEQANLDFSRIYQKIFQSVDDKKSSQLLQTVLEDEIRHVSHGLKWFRIWNSSGFKVKKSDWEEYCRHVSPFFSPARAKGPAFYRAPRKEAGLSEHFINELELFGESKTRPPSVWAFFPFFEEDLNGSKTNIPTTLQNHLTKDLSVLLMFISSPGDHVVTPVLPGSDFIKNLKSLKPGLPRFILPEEVVEAKSDCSAFRPWGWGRQALSFFKPLAHRLTNEQPHIEKFLRPNSHLPELLRKLSSRHWAQEAFHSFLTLKGKEHHQFTGPKSLESLYCHSIESLEEALDILARRSWQKVLIKAPWSSSGRSQVLIDLDKKLSDKLLGRIKNILILQGSISAEPWLEKLCDLSVLTDITPGDQKNPVTGVTRFVTRTNRQYLGHILGRKFSPAEQNLSEALYRHRSDNSSLMDFIKDAVACVSQKLSESGYVGPAGIDALLFTDEAGGIYCKPVVEVNLRYTMGHVALGIEKMLARGSQGIWMIQDKSHWVDNQVISHFGKVCPSEAAVTRGGKIISGFLPTNDPAKTLKFQSGLYVRKI